MSSSELKFLVDVGISKQVEEYLQEQGYDTKTVRAIDSRMLDREIIRLATTEGRMVITMDKDYNGQRFRRVSVSFWNETLRGIIAKIGGCYRFREAESCK